MIGICVTPSCAMGAALDHAGQPEFFALGYSEPELGVLAAARVIGAMSCMHDWSTATNVAIDGAHGVLALGALIGAIPLRTPIQVLGRPEWLPRIGLRRDAGPVEIRRWAIDHLEPLPHPLPSFEPTFEQSVAFGVAVAAIDVARVAR